MEKRDTRTPAHIVPLPVQAVEILRDLRPLTGPTGPVFRSMAKRSEKSRYMSDNTINSALRTLGYDTKEQITGHGFRATARTCHSSRGKLENFRGLVVGPFLTSNAL